MKDDSPPLKDCTNGVALLPCVNNLQRYRRLYQCDGLSHTANVGEVYYITAISDQDRETTSFVQQAICIDSMS
jgi:hypothetical protein